MSETIATLCVACEGSGFGVRGSGWKTNQPATSSAIAAATDKLETRNPKLELSPAANHRDEVAFCFEFRISSFEFWPEPCPLPR
jgi:hypothetical protein